MVKRDHSEIAFVFSYLDNCCKRQTCIKYPCLCLLLFFPYKKRSHKRGHCTDFHSTVQHVVLQASCDWSTQSTRQSACLTVSLSESNLWRPSAAGQIRASPSGQSEKHHCHCDHSHSVNLASSATAWPRGHLTESRPGGLCG